MQTRIPIILVLVLCMTLTTGCWDMLEPNQRALWTGSSIDLASDGHIKFSGQIAVPSVLGGGEGGGGGAKDKPFIVKSAIGLDNDDALQNIQEQLSRKAYVGHREAVFVGEPMAKNGLKKWLDEFGRNPESNVRAKIFAIKGAEGKQFLEKSTELEQFSTVAALRASRLSGIEDKATTIRNFENTMLSDGIRPFMQVIQISPDSGSDLKQGKSSSTNRSAFKIAGIALFNRDTRLVGYLEDEESAMALWTAGDIKGHTVTEFIPRGNGYISLDLKHLKRRLKSSVFGNKVKVEVELWGTGIIRENTSSLNLYNQRDVRYVESEFNQALEQQVQDVIKKVQRQYGTDIFGFGEDIHRRHPYQWIPLKEKWDNKFRNVNVTVKVNLTVKHIGNKGPSHTVPDKNWH